MIQNLLLELEEKKDVQTKDLGSLQKERVILSNQLHDISEDDLKVVVFHNVLGQLEFLVYGLRTFIDSFSL